jgi:hypothetical protein
MSAASATTESVADHEEADRHRGKHDDEQYVEEFHGCIPSKGWNTLFAEADIYGVSRR